MISIPEAKDLVLQNIQVLEVETVPLLQAHGMILAHSVASKIDVPSFDNSAMDGYAIKYEEHLRSYQLTQYIKAGEQLKMELHSGEAAQIFTGAPLPQNADTVIPRELVSLSEGKINFEIKNITRGMHIRKRASQNAVDEIIADRGTFVSPGLIALLSSCGIQTVSVYKRPRVSYTITGNELVEPGSPLQDGSIYNSNGPAIHTFLQSCGIQSIHAFYAPDQKDLLKEKINLALECSDLIIITGGVSAGDFDFVPQVLVELGVLQIFHKVRQKPGKPIFFGKFDRKLIFGLPGNPAAVLACLNQYVKPCIMGIIGHAAIFEAYILLPLLHSWSKKQGLGHLLKAKIENQQVRILEGQESFNLLPFAECNAFIEIGEEVETVEKGTMVKVYPI